MDTVRQATAKSANSVAEFCSEHSISRAFFYLLMARGDGPKTMKVGRRRLISAQAGEDWRRAMEQGAAAGNSDQLIGSNHAVQS